MTTYPLSLFYWGLCLCLLGITGCRPTEDLSVSPPNKRPVSTIEVGDAAEVDILQQQTGIEIVKIEFPLLYFYADKSAVLAALKSAGYEEPKRQDLSQVYARYAKIYGVPNTRDLESLGLKFINREKDHIVVFGNLGQLGGLAKFNLKALKLDYELRPREIFVTVPSIEAVQKLAELQVDIFASYPSKEKREITVEGAAFDFQIDQVKSLGYQVTLK
jgi:hypothetical protein